MSISNRSYGGSSVSANLKILKIVQPTSAELTVEEKIVPLLRTLDTLITIWLGGGACCGEEPDTL
jgi:hypothetical protein